MAKIGSVTYFEKRSINIGDYENVEFCLTLSGVDLKSKPFGNNSVEVSASDKASVTDDSEEAVDEAIKQVIKKVQSHLNALEKKVRTQVSDWQGMGFDTEAKAVKRKVLKEEAYTGSYAKRMYVEDED